MYNSQTMYFRVAGLLVGLAKIHTKRIRSKDGYGYIVYIFFSFSFFTYYKCISHININVILVINTNVTFPIQIKKERKNW